MNAGLQWVGAAAGALIAIGTVLRWAIRRIRRASRWVTAIIVLPETVDRLGHNVETLTGSVATLARALHRHPAPVEENDS
jgi:hypothetical protein